MCGRGPGFFLLGAGASFLWFREQVITLRHNQVVPIDTTFLDGTLTVLIGTESLYSLGFSSPTPRNLTPGETVACIHTGVCIRLFIVALCILEVKRDAAVSFRKAKIESVMKYHYD